MPLSKKHILVVDDTPSIRTFLRILLQAYSAAFHEAATAKEALEICESTELDLVILDLGLPDRNGMDILPDIKKTCGSGNEPPKVIILSVRKEQDIKARAMELGADAYLSKPFLMEDLLEIIEKLLKIEPHP